MYVGVSLLGVILLIVLLVILLSGRERLLGARGGSAALRTDHVPNH